MAARTRPGASERSAGAEQRSRSPSPPQPPAPLTLKPPGNQENQENQENRCCSQQEFTSSLPLPGPVTSMSEEVYASQSVLNPRDRLLVSAVQRATPGPRGCVRASRSVRAGAGASIPGLSVGVSGSTDGLSKSRCLECPSPGRGAVSRGFFGHRTWPTWARTYPRAPRLGPSTAAFWGRSCAAWRSCTLLSQQACSVEADQFPGAG